MERKETEAGKDFRGDKALFLRLLQTFDLISWYWKDNKKHFRREDDLTFVQLTVMVRYIVRMFCTSIRHSAFTLTFIETSPCLHNGGYSSKSRSLNRADKIE